jgi:hypothetical protein
MSSSSKNTMGDEKGLFEGLITALQNKHSQVDLNFVRTSVRFPGTPVSMELNGTITLSVHLRDLTDEEKQAYASKVVSTLSTQSQQ